MSENPEIDNTMHRKRCPMMICPIHGKVDAVNEDADGYHCQIPSCNTVRKQKELE